MTFISTATDVTERYMEEKMLLFFLLLLNIFPLLTECRSKRRKNQSREINLKVIVLIQEFKITVKISSSEDRET